MVDFLQNVIGWTFLCLGAFLSFTGALGMMRMPDFFTRLHPAGIKDALGVPMVLAGVAILEGFTLISLKIFLLIIFLMITSPTATHALAKAATLSGMNSVTKRNNVAGRKK